MLIKHHFYLELINILTFRSNFNFFIINNIQYELIVKVLIVFQSFRRLKLQLIQNFIIRIIVLGNV